jgi:hypothetical protein
MLNRRIWTRQPQIAVGVDWANPITKSLAFCTVGFNRRNLVASIFASSSNGKSSITANGIGSYSDGSDVAVADWSYNNLVGSNGNGTGALTLMAFANPSALAARGFIFGVSMSGSPYKNIGLFANTDRDFGVASGYLSIYGYNSGSIGIGAHATTGVDGFPHVFVGTTTEINLYQNLYIDGKNVTTSSYQRNGNFGTDATSRVCVGNQYPYGSGRAMTGTVILAAAWNRLLSETEILYISKNPWQLFAPLSLPIFAPSAAGSFPVLSNPTMTSLTSTSGYPKVTVTW